jgi:hypothetical protein
LRPTPEVSLRRNNRRFGPLPDSCSAANRHLYSITSSDAYGDRGPIARNALISRYSTPSVPDRNQHALDEVGENAAHVLGYLAFICTGPAGPARGLSGASH